MGLFRRSRDRGSDDFEATTAWGTTGWRPMPVPSQPQQIGVYGDAILNQVPGIWPSTQLNCGRPAIANRWCVLTQSATPYWQQSQQKAMQPGTQRNAGAPGRGMGPIGARGLREQVFRAQVAQSGLAAFDWADALRGWST